MVNRTVTVAANRWLYRGYTFEQEKQLKEIRERMRRVSLRYNDGSDMDYTAIYDVPDSLTGPMIAQLSVEYNKQMGDDDETKYNPAWMYSFDEWVLDTTGIIIIPIDEGEVYDAFTGEPW